MNFLRISGVLLIFLFSLSLTGHQLPYQNPVLSFRERAKDLISRLTLE